MNKQPFYHSAELIFCSTEPLDANQIREFLRKAITDCSAVDKPPIISSSLEVYQVEVDPGDPVDLVN